MKKASLRRIAVTAGLALALGIVPLMSGCGGSDGETSGTAGEGASVATEGSQTSDTGGSTANGGQVYSYSDGIDANGHWEGVTALDHVTLPNDYDAIVVPAAAVNPTEDEVQEQLDLLMSGYAVQNQVTDRALVDGDTVNIDYVGSIDGVEFEGGSTGGMGTTVTIGVTSYIDDFLQQLIGHKPGESFDIEVTFPENYGKEDLNGKDAVFAITINYIVEEELPELTDEWVAANLSETYGWKTVAEAEEAFASMLREEAVLNYVQEYVLANAVVESVPQSMVDYQEASFLAQYSSTASMYGMTLEEIMSMISGATTTEEFIAANRAQIDAAARGFLVFQAIVEDAGIAMGDAEVSAHLLETQTSAVDSLVSYYGMPYLKMNALVDAAIQMLVENATITG